MKILNSNIPNKIALSPNEITFGLTERCYNLDGYKDKIIMGTYTCMFRADMDWFKLAKLEHEVFNDKDKVNVIQFAASSGAEAYTKIISLLETNSPEKTEKFFPIKSYDIDSVIVNVARTGLINLDIVEVEDLLSKNLKIQKYLKPHYQNCNLESNFYDTPQKTYRAENVLKNNVIFNVGDMFKLVNEIEDNSNTIVLCRNSLAYFNTNIQEKFIRSLCNKLKEKSLFEIGDLEESVELKKLLKKYHFKRIMKNVYQKIDNSTVPVPFIEEEDKKSVWEIIKQYLGLS